MRPTSASTSTSTIKPNTPIPELFHDVEPIEQDDGPNPVCSIQYSSNFREAMGYLRAMLQKDERSERSLYLTEKCLKLNPANYTTWHFRRHCLAAISEQRQQHLESNDKKSKYMEDLVCLDLEMSTRLGGPNPKNYQIWYHRRTLLEGLLSNEKIDEEDSPKILEIAEKELKYVELVLEEDAKNYHAWSHRQWILSTVSSSTLYTKELEYIHQLLLSDVRNNSAWNQRWFAAHHGHLTNPLSQEDAKKESEYAWSCIQVDTRNESPWRYFLGVGKEQCKQRGEAGSWWKWNEWEEKLESLGEKDPSPCYMLMGVHVDILEMMGDVESKKKAAGIAKSLALENDTIRGNYWLMREKQLLAEASFCKIA